MSPGDATAASSEPIGLFGPSPETGSCLHPNNEFGPVPGLIPYAHRTLPEWALASSASENE